MQRTIAFLISIYSVGVSYADYASRGKPWDAPDYHESPLTPIFMVIGAIVLIVIGVAWAVCKIQENKGAILDVVGKVFVGGAILGGVMLLGKCGEEIHRSNVSNENSPTSTSSSGSTSELSMPASTQPIQQKYTPTLKYRTVEYYENCFYCNGSGRVVCSKCEGTGRINRTCTHCKGAGDFGQFKCVYCQGKGYTEDPLFGTGRSRCITCSGSGYTTNTCTYCCGSGQLSEICDRDASANNQTHYVSCSHCNGYGKIKQTRQESYYE